MYIGFPRNIGECIYLVSNLGGTLYKNHGSFDGLRVFNTTLLALHAEFLRRGHLHIVKKLD